MKAKWVIIIALLSLIIGGVITYFYLTRNEIKPRQQVINGLIYKVDSLDNKLDSVIIIIGFKDNTIDSLFTIIKRRDTYIYKINKKYENIFNVIKSLSVDDHIVFFTDYLSKEDSLRARYFNNIDTDSTGNVKFFLR